MTPDHLKRLADYLQAEVKLVTDLANLLPNSAELSDEIKTKLDNRVQKFLEYKNAKLDRLKDEITWGKEIGDVLSKVGDLLIQQQSIDSQLKERAMKLYTQNTTNRKPFTDGEIKTLTTNYVRMELAQRQGDIFWFAAYVQKQVETLLNFFLSNLSLDEVNSDLKTEIDFWDFDAKNYRSFQTKGKLGEALFTDPHDGHKNAKSLIVSGKEITNLAPFDFATKLKYFVWRHEFKAPLRPFAYLFSPTQYLSNARNIDSHGGDPTNETNEKKRKRLVEIQSNPAKFFAVFYGILHSVHKHVFGYKNL